MRRDSTLPGSNLCNRRPGRGRRVATAVAGLWVVALGCGPTSHDPVTRGARAIGAAPVAAYGRYLAADARAGRHHASPEADSVVSDLLARLEAIGIGTATRAEALRGRRAVAFPHHFSVSLQDLGESTRFTVAEPTTSRDAVPGSDFLPLLFSTETDVVARPMRLDGRAEALPESQAPYVRGRIVFVPPSGVTSAANETADAGYYRAARRLTECGAAAVVFTDVDDWLQLPAASFPSELPPEWTNAVRSPRGERLNLTAARLGAALQASAWRVAPERTVPALVLRPGWMTGAALPSEARLCVRFRDEVSLGQNVLVGFGGADGGDECILVVAHYDHSGVNSAGEILNGADDNASGVTALFEVARALATVHPTLGRNVLLAFVSAEMQGGQGLEALLRDLPLLVGPLQVRACFVLDAIGANDRDFLAVHGGVENPALLRCLERANQQATLLGPAFWLEPRSRSVARPPFAAAAAVWPHAPTALLLDRAGIPSVLVNDGLDPILYGQPEDDWQGVNVDKVVRVARLLFGAVHELSTERPAAALPAAQTRR